MPGRIALADEEAHRAMVALQDLLRSQTSSARYTMRVTTPDWQRSVRFEAWDDRPGKRFFIRILAPKKDKDTAYLKLGGNLWLYLPKLERDIRIPPSMMLSSWMGSDFTNDDLVKSASVIDDYTHRITARDGDGFTLESLPKDDAPVIWGKLVHVIGKDGIPRSETFYDEHGSQRRLLEFSKVRQMGGRRIPSLWVMHTLDEPGKQTALELEQIEFDPALDDALFTRANLKRSGR
ncbi:MAG: outer membrane lipoprotein-sorting protein [Mariprofundaceae bacterium]|nr:outer membrane lipoprotein-sorting protein [Mariprofundaceae bacterium]